MALDIGPVHFGHNAVHVFAVHIHKQVFLAHIHRAHHFAGQAGFTSDGVYDIQGFYAVGFAEVDPQPGLRPGR